MERPKRGKEVPAATRAALAAQVEAGLTNRRVAEALTVPVGTVSKIAVRVRRGMSPYPRHRWGRPRLLDVRGGAVPAAGGLSELARHRRAAEGAVQPRHASACESTHRWALPSSNGAAHLCRGH